MENTVNSPLPSPPPKKKKKTHSALSCLYFNAHVTVIFLQVLETALHGKRKRPVQGLMLHFMLLLSSYLLIFTSFIVLTFCTFRWLNWSEMTFTLLSRYVKVLPSTKNGETREKSLRRVDNKKFASNIFLLFYPCNLSILYFELISVSRYSKNIAHSSHAVNGPSIIEACCDHRKWWWRWWRCLHLFLCEWIIQWIHLSICCLL